MKIEKQSVPLKTIDIKGKAYVQVNERIRVFRTDEQFKDYRLITSIINLTDDFVVFKAEVFNITNLVVATGHSREVRTDSASFVNKTSYVENAETSAIGRALGSLGIGIETAFATYDEVLIAEATRKELEEKEKKDQAKKIENEYNKKFEEKVAAQKARTPIQETFKPVSDAKQKDLDSIKKSLMSQPNWATKAKEILKEITGCNSWSEVVALPDESLLDIKKLIVFKYTLED